MDHPSRGAGSALFSWRSAWLLFVEIASIQRFVLFLGHPVYAVAVVLCAFMVFAGLGSGRCGPRLEARLAARCRTPPDGRAGSWAAPSIADMRDFPAVGGIDRRALPPPYSPAADLPLADLAADPPEDHLCWS